MTGAEVLVRDGIGILMTVERGRESINNKKARPRAAEVGDIVDFFGRPRLGFLYIRCIYGRANAGPHGRVPETAT